MYLLENLGMNSATEMILSGGSAGATGVFLGLDYVKEWLPPTIKLVGNPDAGFFLDLPRVSNGEYWYRETFAAADGVWNSSASGNVASPACLSAVGPDVYKCYLPEYSMNYIQTPLLASNSALDMWGILNILGLGCVPTQNNASYNGMSACNPAAWEKIQEWWGGFQQRIKAVTGAAPNARSAFIASCFVHEINVDYCSVSFCRRAYLCLSCTYHPFHFLLIPLPYLHLPPFYSFSGAKSPQLQRLGKV